jgi:hypothetical protein
MRGRERQDGGPPPTLAQGVTRLQILCSGLYCPHWAAIDIDQLNLPDITPAIQSRGASDSFAAGAAGGKYLLGSNTRTAGDAGLSRQLTH